MKRFVNGDEVTLEVGVVAVREGDLWRIGEETAAAVQVGEGLLISFRGQQYTVERRDRRGGSASGAHSGEITAPMPGQIVDIRVKVGDVVEAGAVILVLEAMKTQQPFESPFFGQVSAINVQVGHQVRDGDLLAIIKRQESRPSE